MTSIDVTSIDASITLRKDQVIEQLPALHGGPPILAKGPPAWPTAGMNAEVARHLAAASASGDWGRYDGEHLPALEQRAAELTGKEHALAVCSGTYAVELALRACRVGFEGEVILAGYDFPGNFRAIEACDATPVLVDVARGGWTIDCEQLESAWQPSVQAVIVSHLHGQLAEIDKIAAWCAEKEIALIEDACQTPGAILRGKPVGSYGDVSVLSFGGSKLLTAGRGGAIATNREDLLQRAKVAIDRGNRAFPLSELQAVALSAQWPGFSEQQAKRQRSIDRLQQLLEAWEVHQIVMVQPPARDDRSSFYKVGLQLVPQLNERSNALAARRDRWSAHLRAEGVAVDAGFRGFAGRTGNRCRRIGELSHSRHAAAATLLLHHPVLLESDDTIDLVAMAIAKVAKAMQQNEST